MKGLVDDELKLFHRSNEKKKEYRQSVLNLINSAGRAVRVLLSERA